KVRMCAVDPNHLFFLEAYSLQRYSQRLKTLAVETIEKTPPLLTDEHAKHLVEKCARKKFGSHSEWVAAVDNEIHTVLLPQLKPVADVMLLDESAKIMSEQVFNQEIATEYAWT